MEHIDSRGSLVELGEVWRMNISYHFDYEIDDLDQLENCWTFSKCWSSPREIIDDWWLNQLKLKNVWFDQNKFVTTNGRPSRLHWIQKSMLNLQRKSLTVDGWVDWFEWCVNWLSGTWVDGWWFGRLFGESGVHTKGGHQILMNYGVHIIR